MTKDNINNLLKVAININQYRDNLLWDNPYNNSTLFK